MSQTNEDELNKTVDEFVKKSVLVILNSRIKNEIENKIGNIMTKTSCSQTQNLNKKVKFYK